jgi:surface protein
MKKKIFSLLVLLMTAATGAWAEDVLNIVVSGTSATIKYDGNSSNNPYLSGIGWEQSGDEWDRNFAIRPTITTVTIDGSCKNFSGTSLKSLFSSFSGLTTINGLDNLNTVGVQNMESMFAGCSSLTSLDLSSVKTASVTTMYLMFGNCSKLTSLDLSSWNTENVTITNSLFAGCSELTTVDLSSWNTANVLKTTYMFGNCSKLENIYVGDGWSTAAVNNSNNMFKGCTKLPNFDANKVDKTNAHTGEGGYLKVKPAGDYLFTVAPCEHGSGTVKFFVDEKEVKGANEDDVITMTVTPDEGYVVGSVSANAYTTWAGARRTAPFDIPMLGNVTLTPVEGKANTWTFTMPAASVELKVGYLATSNLFLSEEALKDKANIAVTAGETTVEFDDDGKSTTTVIEDNTVTTKYNGTKKILGMKAVKKAAKTITIGDVELTYADGDTWETIVSKNSDKIKTIAGGYIVQVAQPAPNQYRYIKVVLSNKVNPSDIIDPSKNYEWGTIEVYS